MNKLSQLREAAEMAIEYYGSEPWEACPSTDPGAEEFGHMWIVNRFDDRPNQGSIIACEVGPESAPFIAAADPDTIIDLLDALEAAERALTPWLNGEVPLAPTPNAERALAKLAALKGES